MFVGHDKLDASYMKYNHIDDDMRIHEWFT